MIYGKDTLQVQLVTEGYEDGHGDWHEGETSWGEPIACDAQPQQGKAASITLSDGTRYQYQYIITADADTPIIPVNTKVLLTCMGQPAQELVVRGMHRFNTIAQIWV